MWASASGAHLDLVRAPYGLYGVKYIDLAALMPCVLCVHVYACTRVPVHVCCDWVFGVGVHGAAAACVG